MSRGMSADEADDHWSEHGDDSPALAVLREEDAQAKAFTARSGEILANLAIDLGKAADAEALQANQTDAWTDRLEAVVSGRELKARRELAESHREECAILRRRQQALEDGAEALGWKGAT